jgi:hypothetical protein
LLLIAQQHIKGCLHLGRASENDAHAPSGERIHVLAGGGLRPSPGGDVAAQSREDAEIGIRSDAIGLRRCSQRDLS